MKKQNAFSLVEIALALGIISFALVSLLGLMAVGMQAARDANDETTLAMIINRVVADRQNSPFEEPSVIFGVPDLTDVAWTPAIFPLYFTKNGTINSTPAVGRTYFAANISKQSTSPISAQINIKILWPYRGAVLGPQNTNSFSTIITRTRL